jgi:PAS domain S-box-containing protein
MVRTGADDRDHLVAVIVGMVALLGAASVAVIERTSSALAVPAGSTSLDSPAIVLAFVVAAALAERVGVHVLHGDQREDLTFFEIVVVASFLVLDSPWTVCAPLLGLAVSQVIVRRPLVKQVFNLGSYAVATSAAYVTYLLVAGGDARLSSRAVLGLVAAMTVFAVINVGLLFVILRATIGVTMREMVADFWTTTLLMIGASIGVGAMAVAVAPVSPVLVPFLLVPALALWHSYSAVAAQRLERERNAWLVALSGVLTDEGPLDELLVAAGTSICGAFGADECRVLLREDEVERLGQLLGDAPVQVPRTMLPDGWVCGVVVALPLGSGQRGALLLGSARSGADAWTLPAQDAPVVTTVAASLAGAIRSSQHREALAAESSKLKAVVEHASDGIAVMSDAGDVRLWSPAMARITGVSAEHACAGSAAAETVLEPLRELNRRRGLTAVVGPAAASVPVSLTRPDGETRDLSVSTVLARPTDSSAPVSIFTVHDLTSQARADRLKADFIATISHELRTPLTPIKGYAQLLRTKGDAMTPERRRAALDLIAERADHMGRLVEDLLMASRASGSLGSKLATTPVQQDMRDVVTDAVSIFPELAGRLTVELTDDPLPVFCDEVRTVQILSNLLSNAVKYSADVSPITLRLCPTEFGDTHVRVQVIDHGFGIAADDQDRVFQRFYRVEDAMTMRTSGSGLGLYIARELAAVMGGDLYVTSALGVGSTFTLTLPRTGAATADTTLPTPRIA